MAQQTDKAEGSRKTGKERLLMIMKGFVLLSFMTLFAILVNLDASPSRADEVCDCTSCHGSSPHGSTWSECSVCHDSPPQTGTHLTHYGSTTVAVPIYSDTSVTNTDGAYRFGCGNCHPLDFANHNNGVVNVELFNENSPVGSIKAKNPSDAVYVSGPTVSTYPSKMSGGRSFSYSNGTCGNIYCHSGSTVSSGTVGYPIGVDENGNPTYAPYTVTYSRVYTTTPPWGTSGTYTTCTECHAFPLTTSFPSVQAGVGDSHQWIDAYGYGNLHAFNMGYGPISCRTCHYGIVTQANTWSQTSMGVATYHPVPLASRQLHVNGTSDVIFDTINPAAYGTKTYDLNSAAYDPATRTCSTVGCHLQQTIVIWGAPYRWEDSTECAVCHRY